MFKHFFEAPSHPGIFFFGMSGVVCVCVCALWCYCVPKLCVDVRVHCFYRRQYNKKKIIFDHFFFLGFSIPPPPPPLLPSLLSVCQKRWSTLWPLASMSPPAQFIRDVTAKKHALLRWYSQAEQGNLLKQALNLWDLFDAETFLNAFRQQTARSS